MHWFCLGIPVVVAISTAAHVSVQVRILSLLFGYLTIFSVYKGKKEYLLSYSKIFSIFLNSY